MISAYNVVVNIVYSYNTSFLNSWRLTRLGYADTVLPRHTSSDSWYASAGVIDRQGSMKVAQQGILTNNIKIVWCGFADKVKFVPLTCDFIATESAKGKQFKSSQDFHRNFAKVT